MLAQARLPGMRVHGRFRPANYVPCLPRRYASRLNIAHCDCCRLCRLKDLHRFYAVIARVGRPIAGHRWSTVACPKYGQSYVPVPGTNKHKSARLPRKVLE